MNEPLPPLLRLLLLCCALLLLILAAPLAWSGTGSIAAWGVQSLPLLLLLPGLRQGRPRALQWLGFLVLFYLTQGVLQLFTPDPFTRTLGALTLVLCAILFTTAILLLRRGRRPAATGDSAHGRNP